MSKRKARYSTRDPQPESRDPELLPVKTFDSIPIVRIQRASCPACQGTTWRSGGATHPNLPTGELFRWRRCSHCGQSQYHAVPMTESERLKYSGK